MTNDDELKQLQQQITQKQSQKSRAEIELENADRDIAKHRATLKEEFGVETNDEIKALLAQLQQEQADELEAARKALEESSAE